MKCKKGILIFKKLSLVVYKVVEITVESFVSLKKYLQRIFCFKMMGPLELEIYRVKFLKIHKMSFFLLLGPPLDKICSVAPGHKTLCSAQN